MFDLEERQGYSTLPPQNPFQLFDDVLPERNVEHAEGSDLRGDERGRQVIAFLCIILLHKAVLVFGCIRERRRRRGRRMEGHGRGKKGAPREPLWA
jgi:hypothetical protein